MKREWITSRPRGGRRLGEHRPDRSCAIPSFPPPARTALVTSRMEGFGGKGANQAVVAAAMGAVTHVAKVGGDANGLRTLANLRGASVGTTQPRPGRCLPGRTCPCGDSHRHHQRRGRLLRRARRRTHPRPPLARAATNVRGRLRRHHTRRPRRPAPPAWPRPYAGPPTRHGPAPHPAPLVRKEHGNACPSSGC
ncbi:PfkB family carbohydrate kinase [Streptomyces sp. NPDC048611]|uniref:PfkB family carbohydrate kinase n=1 Tax=Streptomyces sp. NPDC048611 TaxID=3155635 RepID=UPI003438DF33